MYRVIMAMMQLTFRGIYCNKCCIFLPLRCVLPCLNKLRWCTNFCPQCVHCMQHVCFLSHFVFLARGCFGTESKTVPFAHIIHRRRKQPKTGGHHIWIILVPFWDKTFWRKWHGHVIDLCSDFNTVSCTNYPLINVYVTLAHSSMPHSDQSYFLFSILQKVRQMVHEPTPVGWQVSILKYYNI